jgi:hypothetical protein
MSGRRTISFPAAYASLSKKDRGFRAPAVYAARGQAIDPYFANVSLLLPLNGANNSTTFIDASSNGFTVTPSGDVKIRTDQSMFGGASAYFDGGSDFLDIAASTAFQFPGDYTIELWVRPDVLTSYMSVLELGAYNDGALIRTSTGGGDLVYVNGSNGNAAGLFTVAAWSHVALVRSGSTNTFYVGGTSAFTIGSGSTLNTTPNGVRIGSALHTIGQHYTGYVDDVRITKGVARYTSNFTPPIAPHPTS